MFLQSPEISTAKLSEAPYDPQTQRIRAPLSM